MDKKDQSKITERLVLESEKCVINSSDFYVIGKGYFNSLRNIHDDMCNSQSIYDAVIEFDNSVGMPKNLLELRKDSFIKKLINYADKWIFYNNFSWEKDKTPDIYYWLLENVEPANSI